MLKTVREILSLLTHSNFEEHLARIKTLVIDSADQLAEVTDLFFEKVSIAFNCSSTTNIYSSFICGYAKLTRLQRTNGCEKEKKKRVTAAKQTPLPK